MWRQAAENVAESLVKGMRVVVQGRLKQRQYETREGEKRTVYELDVEEVGPSLKYATAKVTRTTRQGAGGGYSGGGGGGATQDDPWAQPAPQGGQGGYGGQPAQPARQGGRPAGRRPAGRPAGCAQRPVGRPRRGWSPADEPPF